MDAIIKNQQDQQKKILDWMANATDPKQDLSLEDELAVRQSYMVLLSNFQRCIQVCKTSSIYENLEKKPRIE